MSASQGKTSGLLLAMATASLLLETLLFLAPLVGGEPLVGEAPLNCSPCACDVGPSGEVTANCSHRNLTHIPDNVPDNTSVLLLQGNPLRNLNESSLARLPALVSLDVSSCELVNASNATLASHSLLQDLNLSYNPSLGLNGVTSLVGGLPRNGSLKVLRATRVVPELRLGVTVSQELAEAMEQLPLEELVLDENQIEVVCDGVLDRLPRTLTALSVRRNRLRPGLYMFTLDKLQKLSRLNAEEQFQESSLAFSQDSVARWSEETVSGSPTTTCRTPESIARTLTFLAQVYRGTFNFSLPRSLTYLNISWNQMHFPFKSIEIKAPNLTTLDATFNSFTDLLQPIKGLDNLQHLDLSYNYVLSIGPNFFSMFPQLRILNLSGNHLGLLRTLNEGPKFAGLKSLQSLDLTGNYIMNMDKSLFDGLSSLERLRLYFNSLTRWDVDISGMRNLTYLDIHLNSFEVIPKNLRDQLDSISQGPRRNWSLNIGKNLFKCSCASVDSWSWLKAFIHNHYPYLGMPANLTCTAPNMEVWFLGNETQLENILDRLAKDCTDNSVAVGVLVTIFVFVILFVILAVLAYNRRKLRRYLALGGGPEEERSLLRGSDDTAGSSSRREESTSSRSHIQDGERGLIGH